MHLLPFPPHTLCSASYPGSASPAMMTWPFCAAGIGASMTPSPTLCEIEISCRYEEDLATLKNFSAIGVISVFLAGIFFVLTNITTQLDTPPKFRLYGYFKVGGSEWVSGGGGVCGGGSGSVGMRTQLQSTAPVHSSCAQRLT